MSLANSTADVAMINLLMTGANGTGGGWQDQVQLIPLGMFDDPATFVTRIKDTLPLVNNLRVLFNEHSFNPDGSLHPQMEAFLAAAVAQGFDLTICYGEGDAQNIGIGSGRWPSLTNAEAYAALEENFADVSGAWDAMMAWMEAHPAVAEGVWGWELMNESAAYRHSVRANGRSDGLSVTDFVRLYTDHAIALAEQIDARAAGKILVGGWGYNGDFLAMDRTIRPGENALDAIRQGVGADLVWSAHLYPGWMGTAAALSPADLVARLAEVFAPVARDAVILTEINADGRVNNPAHAPDYQDFYVASYEWFADRGIGFGWYPALQAGASHLVSLEGNGAENYRNQASLGHALNAYSIGQAAGQPAVDEALRVSLVTVRLRNQDYEIAAGEAHFDPVKQAGFAFGFGGQDTLRGTDLSNDFLYGGAGNDVIRGHGADDFLYGQKGNDRLEGGAGHDAIFGGWGADTLVAGSGRDYLAGGKGNDLYVVSDRLDAVIEFAGEGVDTVQTSLEAYRLGDNLEHLVRSGSAAFRGSGNALANRLTGGTGADTLAGLAGRDTLVGGAGNDKLVGGLGADVLNGGSGFDTASYVAATTGVRADLSGILTGTGEAAGDSFIAVEGLEGSGFGDRLWGDAGANRLWGLAGADVLNGRAGNDRLWGGAGADRFVFTAGGQADRVEDFENNIDTLAFAGFAGVRSAAAALARASQSGAHVVFDFGNGDRLTVLNTTLGALADDIVIL
jgi:Ca2+-binding RTX toxin-like protein